jgi:hypothetical protein
MRDQINTITDEITKLLDLQTELFKKKTLHELDPQEVDDYNKRRQRIHQLCWELSNLAA